MSKQQRLIPKVRTDQILQAALDLAVKEGLANVSRDAVAKVAGCSVGLVTLRFGTMAQLRRSLMRRAVANNVLPVLAMGIAAGDKIALALPDNMRKKAMASLA